VLPSFCTLPDSTNAIRFAHCSCRKPHGPGFDAFAWLDDVIGKSPNDVDKRPAVCFLSGDQIYADDVAACLLPVIHQLGHDALGRAAGGDEDVPIKTGKVEGSLANFPPMRRAEFLSTQAKFSTTEADCHLLTFPEFAAMYLLVWSPRVWRKLATADEVFKSLADWGSSAGIVDSLTNWEKAKKIGSTENWKRLAQKKFDEELKNTQSFRDSVPKVARALANVATYMICDDHEVTDDWNLNGRWQARIGSSSTGNWVIANALMAYGVFQAWGNAPTAFVTSAVSGTVTDVQEVTVENVRKKKASFVLGVTANAAAKDRVEVRPAGSPQASPIIGKAADASGKIMTAEFDLAAAVTAGADVDVTIFSPNADFLTEVQNYTAANAPDPGPTSRLKDLIGIGPNGMDLQVRWHYSLAHGNYKFVVMDSRTRRKMPDLFYSPCSLLGDSLNDQIPAPDLGAELMVLISPSPIFGPGVITRMVAPLSSAAFDIKEYCVKRMDDASLPDPTTGQPLTTGDEQFDAEGWSVNPAATEELLARLAPHKQIIVLGGDVHFGFTMDLEYWRKGQNQPDRFALFTSSPAHNGFNPTIEALLRQNANLQKFEKGEAAEQLYWKGGSNISVPDGTKLALSRRVRLKAKPAMIPAAGWPAPLTVPADKAPDAAWRLALVRDQRPASNNSNDPLSQPPLEGPDLTPANALEVFSNIVKRHTLAATSNEAHLRQLVFGTNLGVVRIEAGNPGFKAVQTLLSSRDSDHLSAAAENTVHEVKLVPSGAAAPTMHP
jgi:hypothetical protein